MENQMERLFTVLFAMLLFSGCASTNMTVERKLPGDYYGRCNVDGSEIAFAEGVTASDKLKACFEQKVKTEIVKLNAPTAINKVKLKFDIEKVVIANKGATLLVGALAGKNELHGTLTVLNFEDSVEIGKYKILVDRNYGGYSAFFDLEDKVAQEFVSQAFAQIRQAPVEVKKDEIE